MAWESGLAVCEIDGTTGHDHTSEPLPCTNCAEFACDAHGDYLLEDEEWLCRACLAVERTRLQEAKRMKRNETDWTVPPGETLTEMLAELGMSQRQGAVACRWPSASFHRVCAGTARITPALAVRLERAFGGTADFWMARQVAHDLHIEREKHDDTRYDGSEGMSDQSMSAMLRQGPKVADARWHDDYERGMQ